MIQEHVDVRTGVGPDGCRYLSLVSQNSAEVYLLNRAIAYSPANGGKYAGSGLKTVAGAIYRTSCEVAMTMIPSAEDNLLKLAIGYTLPLAGQVAISLTGNADGSFTGTRSYLDQDAGVPFDFEPITYE